jgi:hypothetical protein
VKAGVPSSRRPTPVVKILVERDRSPIWGALMHPERRRALVASFNPEMTQGPERRICHGLHCQSFLGTQDELDQILPRCVANPAPEDKTGCHPAQSRFFSRSIFPPIDESPEDHEDHNFGIKPGA